MSWIKQEIKTMRVRISQRLHAKLKALAREQQRSMQTIVERLIETAYKNRERKR